MRTHTSSALGLLLNAAVLLASIFCLPLAAFAKRAVPENLGNGLDKLVASNLAIKAGAPPTFNGFAALDDTTLEVRDVNGSVIGSNDNWKDASNAAELNATGLALSIDAESAALITLGRGKYTSIVRGANNTTGVGLAEVYKLDN